LLIDLFLLFKLLSCQPEVIEQSATFGGNRYQIDVDVNTVILSHHHLFSHEHVLASELACLYEEYTARLKKNTVQFLTGKVRMQFSTGKVRTAVLDWQGKNAVLNW